MLKVVKLNPKWSKINMAELDLVKLIAHFAHSNTAEGKSPKTVSWYTKMLSEIALTIQKCHAYHGYTQVGGGSQSVSSQYP
jgi:hypothetical protein